ncbi:MAG TPA: DUF427 domain-containing protein [Rhizomicrobium sp.]
MSGHSTRRIDIRPYDGEVRVVFAGEEVARSTRALALSETGLPLRHYIPAEDVRRDLLTPTATKTRCPFKGIASYWSLAANGREVTDAVWAYLDPIPDCAAIKGHFSFYPEKVDRIEAGSETRG